MSPIFRRKKSTCGFVLNTQACFLVGWNRNEIDLWTDDFRQRLPFCNSPSGVSTLQNGDHFWKMCHFLYAFRTPLIIASGKNRLNSRRLFCHFYGVFCHFQTSKVQSPLRCMKKNCFSHQFKNMGKSFITGLPKVIRIFFQKV